MTIESLLVRCTVTWRVLGGMHGSGSTACWRWGECVGAKFDVLLYDLTSTYFETDEDRGSDDLRQFGYSRDK